MNNINIGSKIREFRLSKKFSLKALAEAAGVSSSLLSQIEKGSANPSINTIKHIADVLDTPLFLFFKNEAPMDSFIVRKEERRSMSFFKGEGTSYELLTPDLSGDIEFMILSLQPGTESSDKRREHKGEEVAYILEGSVKLYLEGEKFTLLQGDSAKINPAMKHKWKNEGEEDAKIIFAINPPCF
ncbi:MULTISPECIES: cupin domain-containing protein [Psychrilyobacter]|uniref:Cupin domain-containing protein n=1 Tax=Psychrilyobacter piezotolerans TaxID=2293438 RepID=A0ABX9KK75_9FUSO|nr:MULTISPECIES: cupin domain-containing protein [Psychrilyobacter]MCS5421739.1 cupin domain-containing protein [Psychrilyobacter sp. S5]NDI77175.1 cupin domain-containing protein [Psychrilyobacter piezotolerans]RDE64167.1 cupin domain-containing protein [Psychrilyobacter sp. S5]REI42259.1 cupin domain-containing protein [Psychrilyobacter piezotolerans]